MDIENVNNGFVSPISSQASAPPSTSNAPSVAPASVDVSVEISPQAQQLAQESIQQTTVAQSSSSNTVGDANTPSQFGANATANNATLASEVSGTSGDTLNASPSNSSQSASVASQYNISPDTALGQTISFSV
ncbi:hypothetical protein DN730_04005 [Marinomonas piezotolerans]|uniref:Uncharacterized protein n=1 Tax=Marinomonas piezotolerans TaxID=2213058 RepID=A0A370UAK8_9GAMM|nr:hypothetical protein [Marinomonas piezotolerans]RDL44788.1 hypothetical protein DN730_04005 [Marinomonas piezotolerans]